MKYTCHNIFDNERGDLNGERIKIVNLLNVKCIIQSLAITKKKNPFNITRSNMISFRSKTECHECNLSILITLAYCCEVWSMQPYWRWNIKSYLEFLKSVGDCYFELILINQY